MSKSNGKDGGADAKRLSVFDTIYMATGFAIGSGIITMTGLAIGMTGRSVPLAFLLSAALFLIAYIPMIIMSSTVPRMSGSYVYTKELLGKRAGGFYIYMFLLGRLTIAVLAIGFAQYFTQLIPGANPVLISVAILTLFYVLNLLGTQTVAKVQSIMVYLLLAAFICMIVFGLPKVNFAEYFSGADFFKNGFWGLFSAASMLFFAVSGAGILSDFGSGIRNPKKVIPGVIIGVTLGVTALYALVGMVSSGVLPYELVANQPLSVAAKEVFGGTNFLYLFFVIGGALLALSTTLNSSFMWYSNAMIKGIEDGWIPKVMAKRNRFNSPYLLQTLFYAIGMVLVLLQIDLLIVSKMAVGLTILVWMIPVCGLLNMNKVYPNEWQASKFSKIPRSVLYIFVILSLVLFGAQMYALFQENPPLSNILIVAYAVIVLVVLFAKKKLPVPGGTALSEE